MRNIGLFLLAAAITFQVLSLDFDHFLSWELNGRHFLVLLLLLVTFAYTWQRSSPITK